MEYPTATLLLVAPVPNRDPLQSSYFSQSRYKQHPLHSNFLNAIDDYGDKKSTISTRLFYEDSAKSDTTITALAMVEMGRSLKLPSIMENTFEDVTYLTEDECASEERHKEIELARIEYEVGTQGKTRSSWVIFASFMFRCDETWIDGPLEGAWDTVEAKRFSRLMKRMVEGFDLGSIGVGKEGSKWSSFFKRLSSMNLCIEPYLPGGMHSTTRQTVLSKRRSAHRRHLPSKRHISYNSASSTNTHAPRLRRRVTYYAPPGLGVPPLAFCLRKEDDETDPLLFFTPFFRRLCLGDAPLVFDLRTNTVVPRAHRLEHFMGEDEDWLKMLCLVKFEVVEERGRMAGRRILEGTVYPLAFAASSTLGPIFEEDEEGEEEDYSSEVESEEMAQDNSYSLTVCTATTTTNSPRSSSPTSSDTSSIFPPTSTSPSDSTFSSLENTSLLTIDSDSVGSSLSSHDRDEKVINIEEWIGISAECGVESDEDDWQYI